MTKIWDQLANAKVIDLSQPMFRGMPQSPNHTPYRMVLDRRHGDVISEAGGSAANDIIVTGTHAGTHIDALAHVSFKGKIFGGIDAQSVMNHMGFSKHGIETVKPFLCRGVFLNVAKALNKMSAGGRIGLLARNGQTLTLDKIDLLITRNISIFGSRGHLGGLYEQLARLYLSDQLPMHLIITKLIHGLGELSQHIIHPQTVIQDNCKVMCQLDKK